MATTPMYKSAKNGTEGPFGHLDKSLKIVVIGAGVAGLAAATRLMENGYTDVTILEAQDRIGGRVHSRQLGKAVIEIGAQWIHGEEGNPVYEIARDNQLVHDEEDSVQALEADFRSQDGEGFYTHLASDFEIIMRHFSEECEEIASNNSTSAHSVKTEKTVLMFFQRRFTEYVKETSDMPRSAVIKEALFRWYCFYRSIIEGCDSLADMSVKTWGDYQECAGNPLINLKNGYRDVIDVLSVGIRTDQIILNKPVRAIHIAKPTEGRLPEGKLPVNVVCQDGEAIQCHHVIVTSSLGYLKRYYNSMFVPSVPESKRQAITQLGYGTVNKMFLEFEKPFWPADSKGYSFLWLDDPSTNSKHGPPIKLTMADVWHKAIVGFYTVLNQPNYLCGWVAGREARFMESLDDAVVIETCVKLLKQFTKNDILPEVVRFVRSNWYGNPYMLGSYSYKSCQCDAIADPIADLAAPMTVLLEDKAVGGYRKHPAIMFAGEATHQTYFSTVHGAMLSGWREADNLATYYKALKDETEQEIVLAETYKDLVSMHRVIIMGAGVAGLAAAEKLIEDGISNVKILEARSVAGGRMSSTYVEDHFEIGAQWIHGERGNDMYLFAQKHYLLDPEAKKQYEAEGQYLTSRSAAVDPELVKKIQDLCLDCIDIYAQVIDREPKCALPSIGEVLQRCLRKHLGDYNHSQEEIAVKTAIFNWFWIYLCIDNACITMNDVSSKAWYAYEECPGDQRISLKLGYQSVVEKMVQNLPKGTIALNSPVQHVLWDRPPLTVNLVRTFDPAPLVMPNVASGSRHGRKQVIVRDQEELELGDDSNENRRILGLRRIIRHPDTYPIQIICESGELYLCEHLVVTTSLGCLKEYAFEMFYPPLTEPKQRIIRTMGFSTVNKIFLIFDTPFWDEDCKGFQFLWLDKDLKSESSLKCQMCETEAKDATVMCEHCEVLYCEGCREGCHPMRGPLSKHRLVPPYQVVSEDANNAATPLPWYCDITGFDTMPTHPHVLLGWIGRQGAIDVEKIPDEEVSEACMSLLRKFTGKPELPDPVKLYRSAWHSDPYVLGSYSYRTVASDKEDSSYADLEAPMFLQLGDYKYPAILFAGEATDRTHYSTVHGAMSSGYREAGRISDFHSTIRQKWVDELEKAMKSSLSIEASIESVGQTKRSTGNVRPKKVKEEKEQE